MKLNFFLIAIIFSASCARAQQAPRHGPNTEGSQTFTASGFGGGGGGGSIGSAGGELQYEPPRDFKVAYVTNDGAFVPTSYMKYEDALALGKKELADAEQFAKNSKRISLGEIARAYRTVRVQTLELQAKAVPVSNDWVGGCGLSSKTCHPL